MSHSMGFPLHTNQASAEAIPNTASRMVVTVHIFVNPKKIFGDISFWM